MKFTNIVLTAVPVLAFAAPNPTFVGRDNREAGEEFGTAIKQGEQTTQAEDSSQDGPGSMHDATEYSEEGHDATHHKIEYADGYERLFDRDLEKRDSVDHYIEECNSTAEDKKCIYTLIVPAGKGTGVCTERVQKEAWEGTLHIIDRNIMCKYYTDANCKGSHSGPYSNGELDYSMSTVRYNQVVENPQSFFCQNIGFQKPNIPVKPPKPDPWPAPEGYSPFLDFALAHSCPTTDVDTGDNCL